MSIYVCNDWLINYILILNIYFILLYTHDTAALPSICKEKVVIGASSPVLRCVHREAPEPFRPHRQSSGVSTERPQNPSDFIASPQVCQQRGPRTLQTSPPVLRCVHREAPERLTPRRQSSGVSTERPQNPSDLTASPQVCPQRGPRTLPVSAAGSIVPCV